MPNPVQLQEVVEFIADCEHRTAPAVPRDAAYAFSIGTPSIRGGRILLDSARPVDQSTYESWTQRGRPQAEDLILAREAPVGDVGRVDGNQRLCLGQRTVLLRPDQRKVNPRFLHYLLLSPPIQQWMQDRAAGSTVAHLNVEDVYKIDLGELPSLAEQRAIAEVLGALDDKIEANRHNVTLISDFIAATWLGSFGVSDAGWPTAPIGDLASVVGGSTPSTKVADFWDGTIAWATPKDLSLLSSTPLLDTERHITELGLQQISSGLLPVGTVLLSSRAPIGYLAIAEVPLAVNQGFIALVPGDRLSNLYLWQWLRSHLDEVISRANGTTFLEISKTNFRPMQVEVPPEGLMRSWTASAAEQYKLIVAKEQETGGLTQLRDTLLPKLLSGELRVRDVESLVEEAV
jgi:type I restriction enzyme S subunit